MEQFCGCWMTNPRYKEDCYWYEEWQDMGAHIPYCRCKKGDFIEPKDCENCEQYHSKHKPTNADRIRSMTGEELADYFSELSCWPNAGREDCRGMANCKDCWLDWLKEESK